MEKATVKQMVPQQEDGKSITAESRVELAGHRKAILFYNIAKERLQQVHKWHEMAGALSARFTLIDKNGMEVNRPPEPGDYFRVDIPGPGRVNGEGYDWVRVEKVVNQILPNSEIYGFQVRPARDPEKKDEDIAHFFSSDSTSSFFVHRNGHIVSAFVFDRNIKPNKDAGNIVDKIRDMMTGSAGMLIFSKLQWKALTEGLLQGAAQK
ncbi:MAG: hypothetical protein J7578_22060 [Chitinophagaceae bacterium]|nr:hypothetical protein [Chitinophagaceae bacterium]